ncbi:MAG: hypothetical protein IPK28_15000 [Devosia sp.]|nr:hypothetical protein [Devosia sp.]
MPANLATVDHVYPRAMLQAVAASDWWRRRNKVRACNACNERKGSRHPVRWLSMLSDCDARDRLATRLLALGRLDWQSGPFRATKKHVCRGALIDD